MHRHGGPREERPGVARASTGLRSPFIPPHAHGMAQIHPEPSNHSHGSQTQLARHFLAQLEAALNKAKGQARHGRRVHAGVEPRQARKQAAVVTYQRLAPLPLRQLLQPRQGMQDWSSQSPR